VIKKINCDGNNLIKKNLVISRLKCGAIECDFLGGKELA
jgi:hypothetical protein